jgi:hypothetical protein
MECRGDSMLIDEERSAELSAQMLPLRFPEALVSFMDEGK